MHPQKTTRVASTSVWTLESIRLLTTCAKWLFEGVTCWSVTSSECAYCQASAPRHWTVSFVPRRSVSVCAAGGSVSAIWTPRVSSKHGSSSVNAAGQQLLFWMECDNGWESRGGAHIHKTRPFGVTCVFWHGKPSPTSQSSIGTHFEQGVKMCFRSVKFLSRQTNFLVAFCDRCLNLSKKDFVKQGGKSAPWLSKQACSRVTEQGWIDNHAEGEILSFLQSFGPKRSPSLL